MIFTFLGIFNSDQNFPKYFSCLTWKLRLFFFQEKILYQLLVELAKKIRPAFPFPSREWKTTSKTLLESSVPSGTADSWPHLPSGPFILDIHQLSNGDNYLMRTKFVGVITVIKLPSQMVVAPWWVWMDGWIGWTTGWG